MTIRYSLAFLKKFKTLDVRIRKSFKQRILIFAKQPQTPQLNNHPLRDEWQGHRSINITSDYRAVYEEIQEKEAVIAHFVTIGTHMELYGQSYR